MIRFALVAMFALVSTSAFAIGPESSWTEILTHKNVTVTAPTVGLTHHYGTLDTNVFHVCRQGDHLETIAELEKVCTQKIQYGHAAGTCVSYDRVKPVSPLVVSHTYCAKQERTRGGLVCRKYGSYTLNFTQPQTVTVKKRVNYGGHTGIVEKVLFEKLFAIPACADIRR